MITGTTENQTGSSTSRCPNGNHEWTWAGPIDQDLEGRLCDCRNVIYHTEICKCCNQPVPKHIEGDFTTSA